MAPAGHSSPITTDGEVQLVAFRLDDQDYALNIENVVQVVRLVAMTRAPQAPDAVAGMVDVRGRVIPVIDLRKRCGLTPKAYDLDTQLLIAQAQGRMMALTVDVVSEVLTLPSGSVESPSEAEPETNLVLAVGKREGRLLLILNPDVLLPAGPAGQARAMRNGVEAAR